MALARHLNLEGFTASRGDPLGGGIKLHLSADVGGDPET